MFRSAPTSNVFADAAPAPPRTSVINGQTYRALNEQPRTRTAFSEGMLAGPDGSTWTPMGPYGGGAGAGGGGADTGGAGTFDADMARINPYLPATPAPFPGAPPPPARVTGPPPADRTAADAAVFGRAKDRIGKIGSGAMKSLNRMMGRRGLAGSGIEGRAMAGEIAGLRGQLGDVVRDQTIEALRRDQAIEDRNYAGDVSQRGQDIGYSTTSRGQDLTGRGQDISAAGQRASSIPALMALLARSRTGAAY